MKVSFLPNGAVVFETGPNFFSLRFEFSAQEIDMWYARSKQARGLINAETEPPEQQI